MTFEKKIPTMNSKPNEEKIDKKEDIKEEKLEEVNENEESTANIGDLKNQIDELIQKNKTLEEKLLYVAAELQNTKRRSSIEIDNANKFAINKFAIDAVAIYDILQTALENTNNKDNIDKSLYDGIKMTINEFDKMFERMQIKKINPEIGSVFDHNKQQAISRVPNELENGCIVQVVRVGYEIYDRLLRPAMVVVSSGK